MRWKLDKGEPEIESANLILEETPIPMKEVLFDAKLCPSQICYITMDDAAT